MTNEEINKRISELKVAKRKCPLFEPTPGCDAFCINCGCQKTHGIHYDGELILRDWSGDATANEELLEEMPQPMLSKYNDADRWYCEPDSGNLNPPTYIPQHLGINKSRKTAICRAWLAWKGQA